MSGIRARDCGVATGIQIYLQEIKDDALLSASEERELAGAIARGDDAARRRMIEANLRLVVKIARDYVGRGIALDDLIGEGNLGLIRATKEYDPRFGTRFSTYASYWIKQAIRHALINTTTTIRLPAHMVGLLTRWRRTERSLCRELRRAPTFEEIAAFMGLSETQKTLVARAHQARQLKLENSLSGEANRWSPEESIDRCDAPDSALEAEDERMLLLSRLDRLDEREAHHPVAAIRPGRRPAADAQGDRPPAGRDARVGAQDRAPRRPQARRPRGRGGPAPRRPPAAAPGHEPRDADPQVGRGRTRHEAPSRGPAPVAIPLLCSGPRRGGLLNRQRSGGRASARAGDVTGPARALPREFRDSSPNRTGSRGVRPTPDRSADGLARRRRWLVV